SVTSSSPLPRGRTPRPRFFPRTRRPREEPPMTSIERISQLASQSPCLMVVYVLVTHLCLLAPSLQVLTPPDIFVYLGRYSLLQFVLTHDDKSRHLFMGGQPCCAG